MAPLGEYQVKLTAAGKTQTSSFKIEMDPNLEGITADDIQKQFDLAIQGEGFFLIETPQGQRLTRAGSFTPSAEGELVTPDGYRLLDADGAPVFVPPDARGVAVAADGTLSAEGQPLAQVGLWQPTDPLSLRHQSGTLFSASDVEPAEGATVLQGMLEDSNVEPVSEIARMIEVQRAYELGQKFLDAEDERVRGVISTLGR